MTDERARRNFSGILSADAVGYSHLMRPDEAATVAALKPVMPGTFSQKDSDVKTPHAKSPGGKISLD